MWIALLVTASFARADDLSVVITNAGSPPVALTFNDVQPGNLPSVIPAPGLRVEVEVTPVPLPAGCPSTQGEDCQPQVRLSSRFYEVSHHKEKLVASPTVIAFIGQQASVRMGSRVPVKAADGSTTLVESALDIQLLYTADAPPEQHSAREAAPDSLDVAVRLTGLRANAEQGWTPIPLAIAETSEPLTDSRVVTVTSGELRVQVFAGAVVEDRVPLNVRVWRSKGRREELIASPTLTADVGQQVTITQGERVPVIAADGTVGWRFDGLDVALTYHSAGGS